MFELVLINKNKDRNRSTSYKNSYSKQNLSIYILIEPLSEIERQKTKDFFYLLKVYISYIVIIITMFDLLSMQILYFTTKISKKSIHNCVYICILLRMISII